MSILDTISKSHNRISNRESKYDIKFVQKCTCKTIYFQLVRHALKQVASLEQNIFLTLQTTEARQYIVFHSNAVI